MKAFIYSHSFVHADLIQSETSWKLFSTSVNVCMKECELIKGGHTFGLLAVKGTD